MIKFFRHIRQNLIMENRTSQYLKYAIGEIVLVVIGILIALQINNWNENRKLNDQFFSILKSVREDLKTDTIIATQVITYYDTVNKYSLKIINKEFNGINIDSCDLCTTLVTRYKQMTLQKKGFNLLQNFSNYNMKTDSLSTELSQFYSIFDDLISNSLQLTKKEVSENLDYFKRQDWFISWMQGQKEPNLSEYFGNSFDYKNRVAMHTIIAAQNYQRIVILYREKATELIEKINKRLKEN